MSLSVVPVIEEARACEAFRRSELADAERRLAVLEREVEVLHTQRDELYERMRRDDSRLCDELEERRDVELRLAEAMGVIRGLTSTPSSGNGSAAVRNRKSIMRGQAALARGAKADLSDQARRSALREAMDALGELPPALAAELVRLEDVVDVGALVVPAGARRRKRGG